MTPYKGLRAIAMFEAFKGCLALVVGLGIHTLAGQDIQQIAEQLVTHLHLNPASHYTNIFITGAGTFTSSRLTVLFFGSIAYALIRFIEAYGLWHNLQWIEWFALVSASIYIPFEIREFYLHMNIISISALFINILIVWYLAYVLINLHKSKNSNVSQNI